MRTFLLRAQVNPAFKVAQPLPPWRTGPADLAGFASSTAGAAWPEFSRPVQQRIEQEENLRTHGSPALVPALREGGVNGSKAQSRRAA